RGSKTFRWKAKYEGDINAAVTLRTDLNVLGEAPPPIPASFSDTKYVFLANAHPAQQRALLSQVQSPRLVVCDTMNLWIETARDDLLKTLSVVHGIVFNDGEARILTVRSNLVEAGPKILEYGPQFVLIKKGEHGSFVIDRQGVFAM